jgi:hypothetical protein
MSVLALPFVGPDPAISERAQQVRSLFDDRGSALTVSARRRWALDDTWCAASAPNWDGYGAMPLSAPVLRAADLFLSAIPEAWPNPEIGADPDGEISFEWARGPHWVFTVSVAADGQLSYAGLFGSSRVHGVEAFAGTLPQAVVGGLARLFGSGAASAR